MGMSPATQYVSTSTRGKILWMTELAATRRRMERSRAYRGRMTMRNETSHAPDATLAPSVRRSRGAKAKIPGR
jgi:hypothetical protein